MQFHIFPPCCPTSLALSRVRMKGKQEGINSDQLLLCWFNDKFTFRVPLGNRARQQRIEQNKVVVEMENKLE